MRRGTFVVIFFAAILAGACSHTAKAYSEQPSIDSLTAQGWKAQASTGMPATLSGLPQVGYLELTSPGGHRLDVQFMQDRAAAEREAEAVAAQDPAFMSVVIGNALVFAPPQGRTPVVAGDVSALGSLLR